MSTVSNANLDTHSLGLYWLATTANARTLVEKVLSGII